MLGMTGDAGETTTRSEVDGCGLWHRLRRFDVVVLLYLALETVLILTSTARLPTWRLHALANIVMAAGVLVLARWAARSPSRVLALMGDWYPVLYVGLMFKRLLVVVPAVHPASYDALLLEWDHALFGALAGQLFDPVASRALTEVLRACWLSFFVLPFLVTIPLYRRKQKGPFREAALTLVLGWLLSFLGYYAVPALGPCYTPEPVPAPECISAEGPTQTVARVLRRVEGDMYDAFPSGHTVVALLVLWLVRRHRLQAWPVLLPVVAGLVSGTVYLRYHYGVDVLAGAVVAFAVMWLVPRWRVLDGAAVAGSTVVASGRPEGVSSSGER